MQIEQNLGLSKDDEVENKNLPQINQIGLFWENHFTKEIDLK